MKQKFRGKKCEAILDMVNIATSVLINSQFYIPKNLTTYQVFKMLIKSNLCQ